jgi:hypothetical protein
MARIQASQPWPVLLYSSVLSVKSVVNGLAGLIQNPRCPRSNLRGQASAGCSRRHRPALERSVFRFPRHNVREIQLKGAAASRRSVDATAILRCSIPALRFFRMAGPPTRYSTGGRGAAQRSAPQFWVRKPRISAPGTRYSRVDGLKCTLHRPGPVRPAPPIGKYGS